MYIDTPWITSEPNISTSSSSFYYETNQTSYYFKKFNPYKSNVRNDAKVKYDSYYSCPDISPGSKYKVEIVLNFTLVNQQNALYAIILILVVILLLFVFSYSFSTAVNDLVVKVN